ncbi:MAG: DsrE family protein [Gracilimonas sp.]|uniref:DsrE family protein n=1 Tax=Gracilimonas sp. TaxID=1974203 RepID=UPI00375015C5|nr:DsrE family protein [Gracilimonas sp.]
MRSTLFILLLLISSTEIVAQEAQFPIIKNFGGIYEIPDSIDPEPETEYNIVIDLKTLQRDKASINPGLNNVARMMNLHGLGGVKAEDLNVAVVIHGGATDLVINNEAYQERYELDNPNLELIDTLRAAGIEIYVCGQSLIAREYGFDEINPQVTKGLSMLTVFTTYMNKGYKPLVFD